MCPMTQTGFAEGTSWKDREPSVDEGYTGVADEAE